MEVLPSLKFPIIDPSYGTDLDFWNCFGMENSILMQNVITNLHLSWLFCWLFWVKRHFETVFQSISGRLQEMGERREQIDERINVVITIPTRTY